MPRALMLSICLLWSSALSAQDKARPEGQAQQAGASSGGEAGLGALLSAQRAPIAAERDEIERIGDALEALAKRRDAVVAEQAIAQGLEALDVARGHREEGRDAAAAGAAQRAWAALSLASRQLARDHMRRELAAAERRVAAAEAELARVRAQAEAAKARLRALRAEATK